MSKSENEGMVTRYGNRYEFWLAVVLAIASCTATAGAFAQSAEAAPDSRTVIGSDETQVRSQATEQREAIVFQLATDILPSGAFQLVSGVKAQPSDWNTLVLTRQKDMSCTATLVGPNVVLMAAHCVDANSTMPLGASFSVDGRHLELSCEIHPAYLLREYQSDSLPRGSEDYALCLLDDHGVIPPSLAALHFEVLDTGLVLKVGDAVLLTGYGCSELRVDGGELVPSKFENVLRIGDASIESAADGIGKDPTYVTVTTGSVDGKKTALCRGDSGGPLFTGASEAAPNLSRRVRGVNSMIRTYRQLDGSYDIISKMAATGTPVFRTWADDWLARNKAKQPLVCGLNRQPGQGPCRN